MLISDIGEIVTAYQQISKLDHLIDAAKNGKIAVSVAGAGQGDELMEAVQKEVVLFLRGQRSVLVRSLEKWGFEE